MPSLSLTFASFFYYQGVTCFLVSYSLNREFKDYGKPDKKYRAEVFQNLQRIHVFYTAVVDLTEASNELSQVVH